MHQKPTFDMKQSVMQRVCYVAVLTCFVFWPETAATTWGLPSTTLDPSGTSSPYVTPCDGKTCPAGRYCGVDENHEASCVCDVNCYYDYYSPVCGSDNRTYASYCALRREACARNPNLTVLYYSACQGGGVCDGVTCASDKECAVDDKHRPICVCKQTCPVYINTVCGSDNETYINECHLQRKSCMTKANVTLAHYGECTRETVCSGYDCSNGTMCAIDENHRPICVCSDNCPYSTDIVCGSDGRTYGNECELQREACFSATDIQVAHKGFCFQGSVCEGYRCSSDKQCTVDQYGRPICVCIQSCPYDYDPVCGSDGVTYSNLCQLKKQACIKSTNITVERTGQCTYEEYCSSVVCPAPKSCVVDKQNRTSCVCMYYCGYTYYPVCGSDNKTYDTYCRMYVAACETNTTISVRYFGLCSQGSNCEGIYCPDGTFCDSENQPEPQCVCNEVCPENYSPVCGSNNETYNNICELKRDACLTNTTVTVQFNRRCDEGPGCDYTYCPYGQECVEDERKQPRCVCSLSCYAGSQEVCGSDSKTYSGSCFLYATACMTNTTIWVQQYRRCRVDNLCTGVVCPSNRYCQVDVDGQPKCVCRNECTGYGSPVCGSNKKTYARLCDIWKESCLTNSSIAWLHYGSCVEDSVCNGVSCPPDRRCAVDQRNRSTCVCIEQCPSVASVVCGSDGRTYYNECEMQKEACLTGTKISLVRRGSCDQGLTCSDVTCAEDRYCALNTANQPTCVCKTNCYGYYYAVCGTDGITYTNQCELQSKACVTDSNIQMAHYGQCQNT